MSRSKNFMFRSRRFFALVMLIATLGAIFPLPWSATPKVNALVPVSETNPALLGDEGVTAGATTATIGEILYEFAESFVKAIVKKKFLDMLVDQIIQWIQGGGKPQFVTDWQGFLADVGNQVTGEFVQEIGLGFLCSPFSLQVQLAILPQGGFASPRGVAACTLDQIVANIDDFYGDFRNGGWLAYTTALQPKNNYFGSVLLAEAELRTRKGNAQLAAQNEATAGAGFLSTKSCEEGNGGGPDLDRDGTPGDISTTCTITTPGDSIGAMTSKALGAELDFIIGADQLEDYAVAIANAAINRLIAEGNAGLSGVSTPKAPPSGIITGPGDLCQGLSGAQLVSCINLVSGSQNFDSARFSTLKSARDTRTHRKDGDVALKAALVAYQSYVPVLQGFLSQINNLQCQNKVTYLANISAELDNATSTIATLQIDIPANQAIIDQLDTAESIALAIPPNDWPALTAFMDQLRQSGIADVSLAVVFESRAKQLLSEIQLRAVQKTREFQNNVTSCQAGF